MVRIVGGIGIEDQPIRRYLERGDELPRENLMDGPGRRPIVSIASITCTFGFHPPGRP
jgi:hypothetical protein